MRRAFLRAALGDEAVEWLKLPTYKRDETVSTFVELPGGVIEALSAAHQALYRLWPYMPADVECMERVQQAIDAVDSVMMFAGYDLHESALAQTSHKKRRG